MDELKLFTASGEPVITLEVPADRTKPIEVVVWNKRVFNRCNGGFYECEALISEAKQMNKPCPKCGYPTFKNHHETFRRCHGCEWTSKEKK